MQGAGVRAPRPRIVVLFVWGIDIQRAVALQGVASRPRAAIICVVREAPWYGKSTRKRKAVIYSVYFVRPVRASRKAKAEQDIA